MVKSKEVIVEAEEEEKLGKLEEFLKEEDEDEDSQLKGERTVLGVVRSRVMVG